MRRRLPQRDDHRRAAPQRRGGATGIVKLLLEAGADPNAAAGRLAALDAAQNGDDESAEALWPPGYASSSVSWR